MSQVQRTTGAIVPVKAHLSALATQVERWRAGDLDDANLALLVERAARAIKVACKCETGRCCAAHDAHTTPHQGCILR